MIIPQTNIRLLKSPIEIDYNNELTFSNVTAQTNYFLTLPYIEMDECSYQRKEERIRFDKSFDELIGYNYCMYQNEDYSNKWFYAFINRIEYVDDSCSYVYITTDVIQTWMFDYTWRSSFIEREHVSDDTVGIHTIDEGLSTGEYVSNGFLEYKEDVSSNAGLNIVCFACSDLPDAFKNSATISSMVGKGKLYNRIYGGLYMIATENVIYANEFIRAMTVSNMLDAIVNVFMVPIWLANDPDTVSVQVSVPTQTGSGDINIVCYLFKNYNDSYIKQIFSVTRPNTLNNYVPKNNKLFVYPYSLFTVSNRTGTEMEFRYEDFYGENSGRKFVEYGALSGGGYTGKLVPYQYKNVPIHYNYGIEKGKLPTCSWSGDAYINWLSQNAINIGRRVLGASIAPAFGAVNSILTNNIEPLSEGVTSSFNAILELEWQKMEAKRIPDSVEGNVNSGDINYSAYFTGYSLNHLTMKPEYILQVDQFFTMFGYKVNELKIPNLNSRLNWNYIKTVGANLIGDIPQDDMKTIKEIFNRGITLWHNPSTFLDYSQNNNIV